MASFASAPDGPLFDHFRRFDALGKQWLARHGFGRAPLDSDGSKPKQEPVEEPEQHHVEPEYLQFLAETAQHRRERDEQRRRKKRQQQEQRRAAQEPRQQNGQDQEARRRMQLRHWYGPTGAQQIEGLESAVQRHFDQLNEQHHPPLWPAMPLNLNPVRASNFRENGCTKETKAVIDAQERPVKVVKKVDADLVLVKRDRQSSKEVLASLMVREKRRNEAEAKRKEALLSNTSPIKLPISIANTEKQIEFIQMLANDSKVRGRAELAECLQKILAMKVDGPIDPEDNLNGLDVLGSKEGDSADERSQTIEITAIAEEDKACAAGNPVDQPDSAAQSVTVIEKELPGPTEQKKKRAQQPKEQPEGRLDRSQLHALHKYRRLHKKGIANAKELGIFVARPRTSIVNRTDFFYRFGEKEKEACDSFKFLDELSAASSSSESETDN